MTPGSRDRLHALDGLRALACLLVLAAHSASGALVPVLTRAGHPGAARLQMTLASSGVDLFFVLSGTVLLRPYLRAGRPFDAATYAWRRFTRLWPPYLAALALTVPVICAATVTPTWYSEQQGLPAFRLGDLGRHLLLVRTGRPLFNGTWWSLSIEVLFYALVPLVLGVARSPRAGKRAFAAVLLVAAALPMAVGDLETPFGDPAYPPWLDLPRVFTWFLASFTCGVMLARFDFSRRAGLLALGLGAVYLPVALEVPRLDYHDGAALLYFGLTVLALQPGGRLARFFSSPFLVWLGERSYSLFLVHLTVFETVQYALSRSQPKSASFFALALGLGVPLAFVAASVLFQVVERRFARGLTTDRQLLPPFGSLLRREAPVSSALSPGAPPAPPPGTSP